MWTFFGTVFLRSTCNITTALAWEEMESPGFVLMDVERCDSILNNLRGFDTIN
jgi:hypothetical protein